MTSLMEQEARESSALVCEQLDKLSASMVSLARELSDRPPRLVITCARGSSDHAGLFGKYLIEQKLGLPVVSAAPSLVSVYDVEQKLSDALMIGLSQSGMSPDIVAYAKMARHAGARTIAVVNTEGSNLAQAVEHTLLLSAGPERSVAATKSYICTIAALMQLVALWSQEDEIGQATAELPDVLARTATVQTSALQQFLLHERSCMIVGRGLGFAIAQEAALKLKETCGIHAEAISTAEVQHGPMALLAQGVPIVFLVHGDRTSDDQVALARKFAEQGARVFIAAPERYNPDLTLEEGQSSIASAVGMIQTFYLMAAGLSVALGNDPDRPPFLNKVTETH